MPKKTGFIKTHTPMFNKPSKFEERWGEPAYKIAERENVSTTTIHMRVRNYGNPYQRKAKPSIWEAKYGKTRNEICKELYIHPVTLTLREKAHGSVYCEDKIEDTGAHRNLKHAGTHWSELPQFKETGFWLMPDHPDYKTERNKCANWQVARNIRIAKERAGE